MTTLIPVASSKKVFQYDTIKDSDYSARIVRISGLGVQKLKPWNGQAKRPAFRIAVQFELLGVETTGKVIENKGALDESVTDMTPKPACMFKTYSVFPGGSRGSLFDLLAAVDPTLKAVPQSVEAILEYINSVVSVRVGSYTTSNQGEAITKNCINGVFAIPTKYAAQEPAAQSPLVTFNPYDKSEDAFVAYSKLFKFQQKMLTEAVDAEHIPHAGKEPMKFENEQQAAVVEKPIAPPKKTVVEEPVVAKEAKVEPLKFDDEVPF